MTKSEEPIAEVPTSPPDLKEFWAIYTHSLDWQILLQRLVVHVDPNHGQKPLNPTYGVIGYEIADPAHTPIWYLSREHFPTEMIAQLVGKTPEDLSGVETLHLRDIKGQDNWEKPNVEYWGMG